MSFLGALLGFGAVSAAFDELDEQPYLAVATGFVSSFDVRDASRPR